MDIVLLQLRLDPESKLALGTTSLRAAIVVPNTRIAYLTGIAFGHAGERHYRVFYNDFVAAMKSLGRPIHDWRRVSKLLDGGPMGSGQLFIRAGVMSRCAAAPCA